MFINSQIFQAPVSSSQNCAQTVVPTLHCLLFKILVCLGITKAFTHTGQIHEFGVSKATSLEVVVWIFQYKVRHDEFLHRMANLLSRPSSSARPSLMSLSSDSKKKHNQKIFQPKYLHTGVHLFFFFCICSCLFFVVFSLFFFFFFFFIIISLFFCF